MKLAAENLDCTLDGQSVLRDVSLRVESGEFVSLIGPNGSGKSTTLRCLSGLLEPSGGRVILEGQPLDHYSRRAIARRLGVVRQNAPVNFNFTVHEIVMMGRSPYKGALDPEDASDREIVARTLERVGLNGFEARQYHTLSGGEQQRVLLARCLAQEADLLILDEPTNHLDVQYELMFLDRLKEQKTGNLVALHDLNRAAQYSDRVYVLENGQLVESGSPEGVFTESLLSEVFQRSATITTDPATGKPQVTFHPGVSVQ